MKLGPHSDFHTCAKPLFYVGDSQCQDVAKQLFKINVYNFYIETLY